MFLYIWSIPNFYIMKKNVIGALVILFVTIAFLLVVDDISKSKDLPVHANSNMYESNQQPDLVGLDEE